MARLLRFVQLMLITGVLLLIAVLLSRAFVTLYQLLQRVVDALGVAQLLDYTLVTVLVFCTLLVLYVVAGRRVIGWQAQNWLKTNASGLHDDYQPQNAVWWEQSASISPAGTQSIMVYLNGGWQPALLIERTAAGAYVVYVPHAATARSGTIYVVESFQVSPLNISPGEMQAIIRQAGKGLASHTGKLFDVG